MSTEFVNGQIWKKLSALILCGLLGCGEPIEQEASRGADVPQTDPAGDVSSESQLEHQIQRFCGDCHVVPMPESFPKAAWHDEVSRGYNFYFESGRRDLVPPVKADVVDYFRKRAPEKLEYAIADDSGLLRNWMQVGSRWKRFGDRDHAVSFVAEFQDSENRISWLLSDMEHGTISVLHSDGDTAWSLADIVHHPAAVRAFDIDSSGSPDLLCAELGSFLPEDHQKGAVVVVRDYGTENQQVDSIIKGIGRVADLQVADIDSDGDVDLVVAEFGWHKTGSVFLLRNQGHTPGQLPTFVREELDHRPGAIHVLLTDLNGDKLLDVVALLSQEHEQVVGYINEKTSFKRHVLYQAPDPSYGSSGISLVDMDGDHDLDVLYTNGDTFDSYLVKPYHGVAWLENCGDLDYKHHRIGSLPGVHRALAADFDDDGDQDVVAVTLLPKETLKTAVNHDFHSVVLFEQQDDQSFAYRVISSGDPSHAAMVLSDIDSDGFVDLVVGNFHSKMDRMPLQLYRNPGQQAR